MSLKSIKLVYTLKFSDKMLSWILIDVQNPSTLQFLNLYRPQSTEMYGCEDWQVKLAQNFKPFYKVMEHQLAGRWLVGISF